MKRRGLVLLLLALFGVSVAQSAIAAGCTSSERKETKLKALLVGLKMKKKGYKLKTSLFDCASTKEKESYAVNNVEARKKHVFIVVGSKYAKDIDSWLTTSDGQAIDSDTKDDALPIVEVASSFKMKLKLKVRVYNSRVSSAQIGILDFVK